MLQRIYYLAALKAVLLLILAGFAGNTTADIHLKDTYYAFPLRQAFVVLALVAGLLFLLYFAGQKLLRRYVLTVIHITGTLCIFFALEVLLYRSVIFHDSWAPGGPSSMLIARSEWIRKLACIAIFWQILLPLNLILSLKSRPGA